MSAVYVPPDLSFSGDWTNYSDLVPTPSNCSHGVQWIWLIMGQCVVDTKGLVAMSFGLLSLVCWIIVSLPQIIENCRSGIADQAISPSMLMFWLSGDLLNLIGGLLAHQLALQVRLIFVFILHSSTSILAFPPLHWERCTSLYFSLAIESIVFPFFIFIGQTNKIMYPFVGIPLLHITVHRLFCLEEFVSIYGYFGCFCAILKSTRSNDIKPLYH